jgi:predicted RNase H-like HicB family nuclease
LRRGYDARPVYRARRVESIRIMKPMGAIKELHVNIRHEDDSLWATVEEFPGVFATGDNLDELRESLEEGISLVLERPNGAVPTVTLQHLRLEPVETTASAELVFA